MAWKILVVVFSTVLHLGNTGSPCPLSSDIFPCHCSQTEGRQTTIACYGLNNSSELQKVTDAMRGMIIDSFIILGNNQNKERPIMDEEENEIESAMGNSTDDARLPKDWLKSLRVREIIIHGFSLSTCFLCDQPLVGQTECLTNMVATHSSLEGHLCAVCNTKHKHVSTRELLKAPKLKSIDLSHNRIQVLNGNSFPVMSDLKKVDLSNNEITKIYDNAFSGLMSLSELDLSRNKISTISRKIFIKNELPLTAIDLSWNSIESLPNDLFPSFRNIKVLKLAHNFLETLPADVWSRLPSLLDVFDIDGNLLACDCRLMWLSTKLHRTAKFSGDCINSGSLEVKDIKSVVSGLTNC